MSEIANGLELVLSHNMPVGMRINKRRMEGVALDVLGDVPVLNGHVHFPQKDGNLWCVGAPYPIVFGDDYVPRILTANASLRIHSTPCLSFAPQVRKRVMRIREPADLVGGIEEGDHIRVILMLYRSEFGMMQEYLHDIRSICERGSVELHGFECEKIERKKLITPGEVKGTQSAKPGDVFHRFCEDHEISVYLMETGEDLMKEDEEQ